MKNLKNTIMSQSPFIHLKVHTAYSLCEGAIKIPNLVTRCIDNNIPAIAITDTNNMFGSLDFSVSLSYNGIQPIIGCLVDFKIEDTIAPLVIIAKNQNGYKNLMKLMSSFYLENKREFSYLPRYINLDNLNKYKEGLIVLSGGYKGPIGNLFIQRNIEKASEVLQDLNSIFKDNFYIEISRTNEPQEKITESFFVDYAFQNDIPLVATNEVFFLDRSMHTAHDALLCIADGTYVSVNDRRKISSEHYLKSSDEMFSLFSDLKEAALNTSIIARRCSFFPEKTSPILPRFFTNKQETDNKQAIDNIDNNNNNEDEILETLANEGLSKRLTNEILKYSENQNIDKDQIKKEYIDRLNFEISVIKNMKFSGYFLIVSDFIKWSKDNDIPVGPGRGSGAGSLVAWCLEITDLDPIKYNLFFERFLNPDRISMPDFDIDFCQNKRDNVIEYVRSKYGKTNVAHIIAIGTLQARAAVKDVGRVLQLPYGLVDKISKLIPNNPGHPLNLTQALEVEPQLRNMMKEDESIEILINTALQLEGLYRHSSMHAAGIVIGNQPIDEIVPLYSDDDDNDLAITQFTMKYVESAGLIKFDFLGLKTLTVIKNTCDYIKKYKNIDIDILKIDLLDKKTFELLCNADVIGVFQLESSGMRDVIQKLQPDSLEDVIALVSLYRPGPMDNIPTYLARKHGIEEIKYIHPLLEPILKPTYGVMIYQEQVMQIAQVMGGFTLASADLLRRAMGKKIKAEMDQSKITFAKGAQEKGIKKEIADQVFALMEKFASYGFNRSHAAAYALISYQTAYLKANYRREFYIASMNLDIDNTDKISIFIEDAKNSGINILLPDINKSDSYFIAEDNLKNPSENSLENSLDNKDSIRYSLGSLKGCSPNIMSLLIKERQKNGKFKDIFDFFKRTKDIGLSSRQIESLIMAGAFDSIHKNRRQIFESLDNLIEYRNNLNSSVKQMSLFTEYKHDTIELKDIDEWNILEKLDLERKAVGLYLSAHPMDIYSQFIKNKKVVRSKDFNKYNNAEITVAGILLSKKEKISKNGQKFAFLTISDQDGTFEISIFSDTFLKYNEYFTVGRALLLDINIKIESENIRLIASSVHDINNIIKYQKVYICIDENSDIDYLYKKIESFDDGDNKISFILSKNNGKKIEIETKYKKDLNIDNRNILQNIKNVEFL